MTMMKTTFAALALAGASAIALPAEAAVTFDLSVYGTGSGCTVDITAPGGLGECQSGAVNIWANGAAATPSDMGSGAYQYAIVNGTSLTINFDQLTTVIVTATLDRAYVEGDTNPYNIVGGNASLAAFRGYQYSATLTSGTIVFAPYTDTAVVVPRGGILFSAVPEPATWAMMIAGFGLVGSALRRRKTAVAFA